MCVRSGSCFGMLSSQSFTVSVGDYDLTRHDPIIKKHPFSKLRKGAFDDRSVISFSVKNRS